MSGKPENKTSIFDLTWWQVLAMYFLFAIGDSIFTRIMDKLLVG